jgi:adenosylcobinamide kinase/adenosylcobinamide-phosphate guanylyltransferase
MDLGPGSPLDPSVPLPGLPPRPPASTGAPSRRERERDRAHDFLQRPTRTLVLGGIRSGMSTYAEGLVTRAERVRHLSTSSRAGGEQDWAERISPRQQRRDHWHTAEPKVNELPLMLAEAGPTEAVLVDDVAGWLVGALDACRGWEVGPDSVAGDCAALVAAIGWCRARLVLVSPEIGLSVIPTTTAGRTFADALGELNQRIAATCDEVVLVVAGLPCPVKPLR